MPLRTAWHNDISTPVSADRNREAILNLLHDHGSLITMSPIVTRYEEAERDGDKIKYAVWEHVDFLPFGLWRKEIKFFCSFENKDDGVVSWIEAPLGLMSKADYSLRTPPNPADVESGGEWELDETIHSSCNFFLRAFVESTMLATRKKMHERILEKARAMQPAPSA